ncbi:histidine kinase [Embleya sp. AB8]|uniref:sensor histidine kinase n=1 Tax=Embleya sp. AB8 TaxID=3156304 RepID=UPI003C7079BB
MVTTIEQPALGDHIDLDDVRIARYRRFAPFFLLAASTVLATLGFANGYGTTGEFIAALATCVVAAGWTWWMDTPRSAGPDRPLRLTVYYWVKWALSAVLVALNPWYAVFAFLGYADARRLGRGRHSMVGMIGTATLCTLAQMGGRDEFTVGHLPIFFSLTAINTIIASGVVLIAYRVQVQSDERKRVIEQLADTNARLETALRENTGLHAQLLSQAREAGVLAERQRMAGEIHDTIAQDLAGIVTQLGAAHEQARRHGGVPADWQRHLDQARDLARAGLTEARRSVEALRPGLLADRVHLPDAIAELVARWSESTGIPAAAETDGVVRTLPVDCEVALFRAAQEALTNVAKHARAGRAGVALTYLDDVVLLDIRDDGVGPIGADDHTDGYGLHAMRHRLTQVGGTVTIEGAPGEGTTVNASVPVGPSTTRSTSDRPTHTSIPPDPNPSHRTPDPTAHAWGATDSRAGHSTSGPAASTSPTTNPGTPHGRPTYADPTPAATPAATPGPAAHAPGATNSRAGRSTSGPAASTSPPTNPGAPHGRPTYVDPTPATTAAATPGPAAHAWGTTNSRAGRSTSGPAPSTSPPTNPGAPHGRPTHADPTPAATPAATPGPVASSAPTDPGAGRGMPAHSAPARATAPADLPGPAAATTTAAGARATRNAPTHPAPDAPAPIPAPARTPAPTGRPRPRSAPKEIPA